MFQIVFWTHHSERKRTLLLGRSKSPRHICSWTNINTSSFVCFLYVFVCLSICLSFHSKNFHLYGDVTFAGEILQILTWTRHSFPLSSEGIKCATPTVTWDIPFSWSIPRTCDIHIGRKAFSSGAITTCSFRVRQTQKLRYDTNEVFSSKLIHNQISLFLLNLLNFYNSCYNFCGWVFEDEVIYRYMHSIMQNVRINEHVCIFSLADLTKVIVKNRTFFRASKKDFL